MTAPSRWHPLGTTSEWTTPEVGSLIAVDHAVYRVDQVEFTPMTDDDLEVWQAAGCPAPERWHGRPVRLRLTYVGGVRPERYRPPPADYPDQYRYTLRASISGHWWYVYPPSGRWPMCSCCGEPMPCRAELEDRAAAKASARLEKLLARVPGSCWHCGEPITSRQRAVFYEGENLDLPIGPPVRFHLRARCLDAAKQYELRWLAADPCRQRVITKPECGGLLVVHADGSSECRPVSIGPRPSEVDCRGHETHDHWSAEACYVAGPCPRGCTPDGHPGAITPR